MTWLKKDDGFPNHRKIRRLSDGAYRLHDTALHFAAHDETDGLIREGDLDEMQHGRRLAKKVGELVDIGLWEPVSGGWMLHDFLDYNPSHEQQEALRAAARERQARARARRAGIKDEPTDSDASRRDSRVTHGDVTRESQPPVPGRSVPGRTDPSRPVVTSGDSKTNRHLGDDASPESFGLGGDL